MISLASPYKNFSIKQNAGLSFQKDCPPMHSKIVQIMLIDGHHLFYILLIFCFCNSTFLRTQEGMALSER